MKKSLIFLLILIPFLSLANNQEIKSEHTKMIQAACASLMRDMMKQYRKSFFCYTSNNITDGTNGAFLTETLDSGPAVTMVRFSNVYYEDPENQAGTLYYSYNINDLDLAIRTIQSGGGLTEERYDYLACRHSLNTFKKDADETNKQYIDKKISPKDYEIIHGAQLNAISNIEKQCPS